MLKPDVPRLERNSVKGPEAPHVSLGVVVLPFADLRSHVVRTTDTRSVVRDGGVGEELGDAEVAELDHPRSAQQALAPGPFACPSTPSISLLQECIIRGRTSAFPQRKRIYWTSIGNAIVEKTSVGGQNAIAVSAVSSQSAFAVSERAE